MALDLGELVGTLRMDITPLEASLSKAELDAAQTAAKIKAETSDLDTDATITVKTDRSGLDALNTDLDTSKGKLGGFRDQAQVDLLEMGSSVGGLMTKAGMAGPAIMAVGAALSAVAAGGVAVVSAVGPAAAAGLVVYAGGMLAIRTASAATRFALEGVSEAVAGDQEAFDKLTPAGQSLVTQLKAFKPELTAIRGQVQAGLFPGLDTALTMLAGDYLPMVKTAAGETGVVLGGLAVEAAKTADSPMFKASFGEIVEGNSKTLGSLGGAGISLASAAVHLFASAQPLINTFFKWADGAAGTIEQTVMAANESGRLADFWDKAASRGALLGGILGNVGGALGTVFAIGASDGAGGQMLETLEDTTAELKKWTDSADGAAAIAGWFEEGRVNLEAMWGLLTSVTGGLSDIGSGAQLAPLIDQITNEVIPPLMEFLGNASASGALGALVTAVGEVLGVFAKLSENDASLKSFAWTLGALAEAAGWVIDNVPGAGDALGLFFTVMGIGMALNMVGLGGVITSLGLAMLGMGGRALVGAGWVAAAWVTTTGASMAGALVSFGVAVATTVGGWILMGAQSLIQAGRMAAAWLIAMGPIGLAIAAVAGIAFLIYKNWDDIKTWTGNAWDWVVDKVRGVPGKLLGFFMNYTLPGLVIKHFDALKTGAIEKSQQLVGWVSGLPGRLINQLSSLGGSLGNAAREHFQRFRDGAEDKAAQLMGWVSNVPGRIANNVGNLGGLLKSRGDDVIQGLKQGAEDKAVALMTWVGNIPGNLKSKVGDLGGLLKDAGIAVVQGLINGITEKFESLKDKIAEMTKWLKDNKGPKAVDLVLWRPAGNWIMQGLMAGLDDQMPSLERKVTSITGTLADPGFATPAMAGAASRVPESAEVARYAVSQSPAAQPVGTSITNYIYETTSASATAAETSRRQAFAGASA